MKESPRINITEEQERQETSNCFIAAVIVVSGMLSILIYGMAWVSSAEKVSAEIYGAKHLENRIELLENEYREHTHRYHDGKIKEAPHD